LAASTENWVSIRPDQLRVGHFIKINHRWFDHPFLRRIFRITSEEEIAIIRNAGLTRLYVDYDRSPVVSSDQTVQKAPDTDQKIEQAAAKLVAEKAAANERIQHETRAMSTVQARYRASVERAHTMMAMLNATDPNSAKTMGVYVDQVVETLAGGASPLTLVATAAPLSSRQRIALLSSDAVMLAGAIGKRMGLSKKELQTLSMASALHLVGLQRMPPDLAEEKPGTEYKSSPVFRNYPIISAHVARECGGFSGDVLRLISEHRELPDGSGFPRGLTMDNIHPLAGILGTVREFQVQCSADKASPAGALAFMYKNMREVYGKEVVNHLIASLTVYPPGTYVLLSDGSIARVLRVNEDNRLRPVVGIMDDESREQDQQIVDLSREADIGIAQFADQTLLPRNVIEQNQNTWTGFAMTPADLLSEVQREEDVA
jgi:HD-GYP domain-containing protein (c-di-GMP phosphodiesterase class II)